MGNTRTIEGIFCISLDFEKYWGLHDIGPWQEKVEQLQEVEGVVMRLLDEFEAQQIQASWAVVGLLAEKEATSKNLEQIPYANSEYSPFPLQTKKYEGIPNGIIEAEAEIEKILSTAGQELCSHTYSHFYTIEEGIQTADFELDLGRMKQVAASLDTEFSSIVFPRNQINKDCLRLLAAEGYTVFRGNQKNNLWANSPYSKESLGKKGKRFLDAYYNISNTQSTSLNSLSVEEGLLNIPASRFFRPSSGKAILEKRKIKRIKEEMTTAAQAGEIYHLWWHPHNFALRTSQHFDQLNDILTHFHSLKNEFGMHSLNMKEIGKAAQK